MGGSINSPNPNTDQTVKIYDSFYSYEATVSQLEYDAVYSYFLKEFATPEQAGNFSIALFRISEESNIPVMTLLQDFQGKSKPEITLTLAYYLNTLRSPTTLLGLSAKVTPNFYVARNVRA